MAATQSKELPSKEIAPEQPTILRIKRKRNEEPLDALVVDQGPKKKRSKAALRVFQFAGTVEEDTWDDERRKKELQERIATLARETPKKDEAATEASSTAEAQPSQPPPRLPQPDPNRSYTVVPTDSQEVPKSPRPTAPPKVLTKEDYEQQTFKMYEAIPSSGSLASEGVDPEVAKFLPMLQEYLKVSDITPSTSQETAPAKEDYVWDVFYSRPATDHEWSNQLQLNIGTVSGIPESALGYIDSDSDYEVDDEEDEDSNAEDFYRNDYPEEESDMDWDTWSNRSDSDSDVWHETSSHESLFRASDINENVYDF